MQIQCKTTGCSGHVSYSPLTIPLTLFSTAFHENNIPMAGLIRLPDFDNAVTKIVASDRNDYNSTELIFLTCDNNNTGPHTNSYDVPTK